MLKSQLDTTSGAMTGPTSFLFLFPKNHGFGPQKGRLFDSVFGEGFWDWMSKLPPEIRLKSGLILRFDSLFASLINVFILSSSATNSLRLSCRATPATCFFVGSLSGSCS